MSGNAINSKIKKRIEQFNAGQIPEGYKKEFGYICPKDWSTKKLNELFKKAVKKNKEHQELPALTNSAVSGVVLQDGYFDRELITESNTNNYYIVEDNDFMYNPRISANAPAGPINKNRLNITGIASPLYTIFRAKEGININFYESYFKSSFWHNYMKSVANQGARHDRLNLLDNDFFNMPLPVPIKEEQQKISEILSTCDRVIELKEKLLIEKEKQKSWLMQKLLTGEIRLKGFGEPIKYLTNKQNDNAYLIDKIKAYNYPKDWQKKEMNNLFNFDGGLSASRESLSNNGICYIHYGDIHTSNKTYIEVSKEKELLPKIDLNVDSLADKYFLNDGDMVFVDASEDYEGGSKYIVIKKDDNTPIVAGLHTIIVRSKNSMLDNNFKQFCFQNPIIKRQIAFYVTGTSVFGLSKSNLAKLVIPIPPIEEQKAISKILSSADKGIDLLKQEIDKYKQLKKSLMQLLLTGIVRVNELNVSNKPQVKQEAPAC